MHLTLKELDDKEQWQRAGIELPRFDSAKMRETTAKTPVWVHFGAGIIFRVFPAVYIADTSKVSFPCTMIDKITPQPDVDVAKMLSDCGLEGGEVKHNAKGMSIAPFVNAEETQYLVITDDFPNGRPALEKTGVLFTDPLLEKLQTQLASVKVGAQPAISIDKSNYHDVLQMILSDEKLFAVNLWAPLKTSVFRGVP